VAGRPRAAATRRLGWGLAACLAPTVLNVLAGCARSGTVTEEPPEPEAVVVYPAQLMSEHPLYPAVAGLSARLAALGESPDLRAVRALASEPLQRRLLGPPRIEPPVSGALAVWEAEADAALAADVQEAEESLGAWPDPEPAKTQAQLQRETADAVREAQNEAEIERLSLEVREIERRRDELVELRRLAVSEDRDEAAAALDRQAAVWREITARVEAAEREAEAKLRALREAGEAEVARAVEEARRRAGAERRAHIEALRAAGAEMREQQPDRVEAATRRAEAADVTEVPLPPDVTELSALLQQIEAAQQSAHRRRAERLTAARARLLREIALSTQGAVQAVAARNGLDARFASDTSQALRDATEEFRPLLREYWGARPALAGTGPADRGETPEGARP